MNTATPESVTADLIRRSLRLAVASGKGGTGKTLVATSLTRILAEAGLAPCLVDVDVEEPNSDILLAGRVKEERLAQRPIPAIDGAKCNRCGRCAEACRFNALAVLPDEVLLFPELCHSCGVCAFVCPQQAITEIPSPCGTIDESELIEGGSLITGRLRIGETSPVFLIKETKRTANADLVILDCPPGTSCAMLEAVEGSDFCLLVTEMSPFGLHDLELALEAVRLKGIPHGVLVNRYRGEIPEFETKLRELGAEVFGCLPFDRELAVAYSKGQDLFKAAPWLPAALKDVLAKIEARLR